MAQNEILSMIPSDTIDKIKMYDHKPEFRVYAIGHEGDVHGNVIGRGQTAVKYLRDVIVQMFEKLPFGLPAFFGHAQGTNEHDGRVRVGEVVGKTIKDIGGKLHTLAAVYINKESRDKPLDVASIEANFEGVEEGDGLNVVNIDDLTGLALGNSAVERPGFPGATLLGAIQAFSESKGIQHMTISKEDLKKAIKEQSIQVEELYSTEVIIASEPARKAMQEKHEHVRRIEEKLGKVDEEKIKLSNENENLKTQLKDKTETINKTRVTTLLDGVAKDRKLTDKFKKYVDKNLKDFKSEGEEDASIKEDLNKFIDETGKQFESDGKEFGFEAKMTEESNDDGKGGTKKAPGAGDDEPNEDYEETSEYEDPAKNDLIPQPAKAATS